MTTPAIRRPIRITKLTAENLAKIEKLAPGITTSKGLQVVETYMDASKIVGEMIADDLEHYEVTGFRVMPIGGNTLETATGWYFTHSVVPREKAIVVEEEVAEEPKVEAPAKNKKRFWLF